MTKQEAQDNGHITHSLEGLCILLMCADPTPLTPVQDEWVKRHADGMARKMGFVDWVDAYHKLT